ncbi:uncharacterized protein EAE98_007721 [Botrytis deweyae]|uniref:Major facilitator superfamily (MFS) profile domain-containing protein n=1 Tax=Botrytis deweyae TaxID=2478750 RepID=A0ABQ7IHC9_9HELO|nr:uncharacterized protein EAE98_007721 [Botrytis deweyae]KAF7923903.1 hypothetical protein EAE98_007721 [Botrytis deweyae]
MNTQWIILTQEGFHRTLLKFLGPRSVVEIPCFDRDGRNTTNCSLLPAWETISKDTNVSLTNMNGGSALNYLLLGFCNIFWIPAAKRLGNRFVFLATTLICMCAGI